LEEQELIIQRRLRRRRMVGRLSIRRPVEQTNTSTPQRRLRRRQVDDGYRLAFI